MKNIDGIKKKYYNSNKGFLKKNCLLVRNYYVFNDSHYFIKNLVVFFKKLIDIFYLYSKYYKIQSLTETSLYKLK